MHTLCHRTTEFDVVKYSENRFVFRGQPRRHTKGGGQRSSFLWFTSIYAYILCRGTTRFDVVTHVGEGLVSWVSHSSHPREQSSSGPILGVLLYFCLHHLTQYYRIGHGDTRRWTCFRRSASPLHLQKCVARFVSDS